MQYFLAIGLGGSLGAASRYLLSNAISGRSKTPFPLATWTINLSGSFLLGLSIGLQPQLLIHPDLEAMIVLGFLSSYTTFSTFAYEGLILLQQGQIKISLLYLFSSILLGLLAAYLGLFISGIIN
jgi:CrcB protein